MSSPHLRGRSISHAPDAGKARALQNGATENRLYVDWALRSLEDDPSYTGKVWTAYALRTFSQFIEPWELPPVVTDGSRRATLVEGVALEPNMAPSR